MASIKFWKQFSQPPNETTNNTKHTMVYHQRQQEPDQPPPSPPSSPEISNVNNNNNNNTTIPHQQSTTSTIHSNNNNNNIFIQNITGAQSLLTRKNHGSIQNATIDGILLLKSNHLVLKLSQSSSSAAPLTTLSTTGTIANNRSVRPNDILLHFFDEFALDMTSQMKTIATSTNDEKTTKSSSNHMISELVVESLENIKVVQSNTIDMRNDHTSSDHALSVPYRHHNNGDIDDDEGELMESQELDEKVQCDHPYSLVAVSDTVIQLHVSKKKRKLPENEISVKEEYYDDDDDDDNMDGHRRGRRFFVRFHHVSSVVENDHPTRQKNTIGEDNTSEENNVSEVNGSSNGAASVLYADKQSTESMSATSETTSGAVNAVRSDLMTATEYAKTLQALSDESAATTTTITNANSTVGPTAVISGDQAPPNRASTTNVGAPPKYTYTPIALLPTSGIANIYGVVIDYTNIRPLNNQFQVSLTLTDESVDTTADAMPLTIRILGRNKIPEVMCLGQVIRIHRLRMSTWRNEKEGKFDYTSSFVLFKETEGDLESLAVESTSANKNTFEPSDNNHISEIRRFRNALLSDKLKMEAIYSTKLQYQLSLKEVNDALVKDPKHHGWYDVVGKIVRMKRLQNDRCIEMVVSDGTKFKKDRVKCLDPTYFGSEVTVIVSNTSMVTYIKNNPTRLTAGKWCKLRNITTFTSTLPSDDNELVYEIKSGDKSSIVALPDDYYHVLHLQQVFDKKQKKRKRKREQAEQAIENATKRSKPSPWSVVRYSDAPVTPIKQVLSHSDPPHKFRCHATFYDYYFPDQSEYSDLLFQVCIQEDENRLVAYVQGREARYFLGIEQDATLTKYIEVIKQRLKRAKEAKAQLDICLVSFTCAGTQENAKRYHVYGTKLQNFAS